ncbi:sarcosine oxidase subunit beta [Dethiosulfatibacter aminovorans DSM 17477]|uniref:Sarcosine oxidase subunit beta n=1 Tax=Dethiosulfatibacter aminovorans DSM 17477 TaxID=1121476 RepID=A0A1M6IWX6_9FIRM|nr:FAD-binding oxidoreductase [Dethiosulfatibacter aminovorans]SHJ38940.1 sarcosine oxidase subunit beta [Dethiosulfatibacter aminovorans DSM 17477]
MKNYDVAVIGGGIIGCSTAYYLSKAGKKVLILEKNGIGSGTSSACDGFIYLQTKKAGIHLKLAMESAKIYECLSDELGYEVHYKRTGGLILIENEELLEIMEHVVEEQKKIGIDIDIISGNLAREIEPALSENIMAASYSSWDGHVNPIDATLAYARAAEDNGTEIWCNTPVEDLIINEGRVEGVITSKGAVKAEYIVNACGVWAPEVGKMAGMDIPIKPRRGHTLVTEALAPMLNKVLLDARYIAIKHHPEMAKNTEDRSLQLGIGLSIEQTESGNLLIGNNREFAGFDTDTTFEVTKEIAKYCSRFVPFLKDVNIIRTFTGLRPYTPDGMPILGKVDGLEGMIMAAGHEGDGIALAPMTGVLMAELIAEGKTSMDIDMFNYSRFADRLVFEGGVK